MPRILTSYHTQISSSMRKNHENPLFSGFCGCLFFRIQVSQTFLLFATSFHFEKRIVSEHTITLTTTAFTCTLSQVLQAKTSVHDVFMCTSEMVALVAKSSSIQLDFSWIMGKINSIYYRYTCILYHFLLFSLIFCYFLITPMTFLVLFYHKNKRHDGNLKETYGCGI